MEPDAAPCVFCRIVTRDVDADVVWADSVATAFLDRSPLFLGHTLVVPNQHVLQLSDLPGEMVGPFFRRVQLLAAVVPVSLDATGTFVAMNNIVSQSVAHLHAHVVPRRKGDGLRGFFWPRQKYADGQSLLFADRLRHTLASFDTVTFLAER
jgi:histidine triad (HIT) family protein